MARHARGRASQPRGPLKQRVGSVLPLALVSLVSAALWCAAFTAAWRHERDSADRVVPAVSSP